MEIIHLCINKNFRYLWLKTVIDVDLNNHCARCLIGDYNNILNPKKKEYFNVSLPDEVHYLCGVAFPYNYENNFHLAFKPNENNELSYSDKGIEVVVKDAEQLPISELYVNKSHPKSNKKSFYTCRNWQFANYFNDYLR